MKPIILTIMALACAVCARGEAVSTDPVGAFKFTPLPQSDTRMSLPVHRGAVYEGLVSSVSGNVVALQNAAFTANAFVYEKGVQANTYYLLAMSGTREGMYYTVTANAAAAVTLDAAGDDLAAALPAGTRVQIIPYWTLGTLFPNGEGVTPSASHFARKTQILIPNLETAGTNLSSAKTYYYFSGATPGWRLVGGGLSTVKDDDILLPDSYFIYRQNADAANEIVMTGSVQMAKPGIIIGTLEANAAQDNAIAFTVARPITLAQSNLYESGAFKGAASHMSRADLLLVFDNDVAGFNKSAAATYYYYTGTNPGWCKVGGGIANRFDDEAVFQPGCGYEIRKGAAATASSQFVSANPDYLE